MTDLSQDFARLGPWVTRFVIDGRAYGGAYDAAGDGRVRQFLGSCPLGARLLELGSLEGGHTFALARYAEEVVAVEGRAENVARAEFVRQALGVGNARFVRGDLERVDLSALGRFGAAFCVGVLYHLPRPWDLLSGLARVTDRVFVWTHYSDRAEASEGGRPGRWYQEKGRADPLSGLSGRSFWPTRGGLLEMFFDNFLAVELVAEEQNPNGPALAAWLTGSRSG